MTGARGSIGSVKMHGSTESGLVIRPSDILSVCRRVIVSASRLFSPDILQAVAVKGLWRATLVTLPAKSAGETDGWSGWRQVSMGQLELSEPLCV